MSDTATTGAAPTATTSTNNSAPILGGASTATAPDTSAATQQPAATTTSTAAANWNWTKEDGSFNDGWRDRLPDDLKGVKDLEKYKDLTSVLRSNVHAQKMIGADRLPLPGKNGSATPEEWAKWDGWNKLGRPETPDKYDLKALKELDKSIPYDYAGETAMVAKMHALGMTQSQVAGLLGEYRNSVGGSFGEITKKQEGERIAVSDGLRKEYGQAFDAKMLQASNFVRDVVGEEAEALLQKHQFDPVFIKFAVKASEATREDTSARGGQSARLDGALSPAEAKMEIESLKQEAHKDPKHALVDKNNPGYAAAQARWAKLHGFLG